MKGLGGRGWCLEMRLERKCDQCKGVIKRRIQGSCYRIPVTGLIISALAIKSIGPSDELPCLLARHSYSRTQDRELGCRERGLERHVVFSRRTRLGGEAEGSPELPWGS